MSNKSSILYNILSYLILDLHSFLLFPNFTLLIKKNWTCIFSIFLFCFLLNFFLQNSKYCFSTRNSFAFRPKLIFSVSITYLRPFKTFSEPSTWPCFSKKPCSLFFKIKSFSEPLARDQAVLTMDERVLRTVFRKWVILFAVMELHGNHTLPSFYLLFWIKGGGARTEFRFSENWNSVRAPPLKFPVGGVRS